MDDRMKKALEHAEKVQEMYGLNIKGNTLALLEETANRGDSEEDVYDLHDRWNAFGAGIIRDDEQECSGHMSTRDIGIMSAECRELADHVVLTTDSIEGARKILKG